MILCPVSDGGLKVRAQSGFNLFFPPGGHTVGTITIRNLIADTHKLLPNATFAITPNPFTLKGSLRVHDNDRGIILLKDVKFSPYLINETSNPTGFGPILLKARVTVHETNPNPVVTIENKELRKPLIGPIKVSAPDLNDSSFNSFLSNGAVIGAAHIGKVNELPSGLLLTSQQQLATTIVPKAVAFRTAAPVTSSASQMFKLFDIPAYPAPVPNIAPHIIYLAPSFVIRQVGSSDNFTLSPIIAKVFPGMGLVMEPNSAVGSGSSVLKEIKMRFAEKGSNVGLSFGASQTIPDNLRLVKKLPKPPVDTQAMFLNVGFVGQSQEPKTGVNFSNPNSFSSSPQLKVLVSKSLNITRLTDGCPDVQLLSFNESAGKWQTLDKPARDAATDAQDKCGYTLQTSHFSEFVVGGMRPLRPQTTF